MTRGEISLEGEASLEEAVLEPPGDWMGCGELSSVENERAVATQTTNEYMLTQLLILPEYRWKWCGLKKHFSHVLMFHSPTEGGCHANNSSF